MLIYKIKKLYLLQGITVLYGSYIPYSLLLYRLYVFVLYKIQGGGEVNSVEPIKDKAVVNDIIGYLKLKSDRDAMLFTFGIYSGCLLYTS